MKRKTSVSLSAELLAEIDRQTSDSRSRSDFLEEAAWALIQERRRQEIDRRDQRLVDERSGSLNAEAEDVLTYQVPL